MQNKKTNGKVKRMIYIPPGLDKRIRLEAVERGTNCSSLVVEALEQFIKPQGEPNGRRTTR